MPSYQHRSSTYAGGRWLEGHSEDIQSYIIERNPTDIQTLTKIIRQYRAAYPNKSVKPSVEENFVCFAQDKNARYNSDDKVKCNKCHKLGHFTSQCRSRTTECSYCHKRVTKLMNVGKKQAVSKNQNFDRPTSPTQRYSNREQYNLNKAPRNNKPDNNKPRYRSHSQDSRPQYMPNRSYYNEHSTMTVIAKSNGLKFYPGFVGDKKVEVLRDTGSTSTLVHERFVHANRFTGNHVQATAFNGTVSKLPEAIIYVTTPFFSGQTKELVTPNLPVDLIIGNIEGVKECTPQELAECTNAIEQGQKCLAVMTRSMSRQQEHLAPEQVSQNNHMATSVTQVMQNATEPVTSPVASNNQEHSTWTPPVTSSPSLPVISPPPIPECPLLNFEEQDKSHEPEADTYIQSTLAIPDKRKTMQLDSNTHTSIPHLKECESTQEAITTKNIESQRILHEHMKSRYFAQGDQVNLLLPDWSNKLFYKWQGPFTITRKISNLLYEINVNKVTKVFHVHMFEHYHETDNEDIKAEVDNFTSLATIPEEEETSSTPIPEIDVSLPASNQIDIPKVITLDDIALQRVKDTKVFTDHADFFTGVSETFPVLQFENNSESNNIDNTKLHPPSTQGATFLQKGTNELLQHCCIDRLNSDMFSHCSIEHSNAKHSATIVLQHQSSSTRKLSFGFGQFLFSPNSNAVQSDIICEIIMTWRQQLHKLKDLFFKFRKRTCTSMSAIQKGSELYISTLHMYYSIFSVT
ncbi:uncharacterized protein LOC129928593 [Biomphalaria glabrata]|uniref:Uncharacterized protein LOC129928593 n=1 Tax=Biomphalaria glabrata TaxID=6526 RepID=A0A9W3BIK9_BIOGL|nr:uncharacterized protein LOC129928593 [Biomphalaria glabrata]